MTATNVSTPAQTSAAPIHVGMRFGTALEKMYEMHEVANECGEKITRTKQFEGSPNLAKDEYLKTVFNVGDYSLEQTYRGKDKNYTLEVTIFNDCVNTYYSNGEKYANSLSNPKFDMIMSNDGTMVAHDNNGNGIVDEGEIDIVW